MTLSATTAPEATVTDHSKMVVTLLVLGAATGLLALGRLSGAEWVSAVTWTVAAFMLGHVGAVVATGWSVQSTAKAMAMLDAIKARP